MNNYQYFHTYQNLANAGTVQPLLCPDCDEELIVVLGDEEPALWCPAEDALFIPGIDTIQQVRNVVKEHYL